MTQLKKSKKEEMPLASMFTDILNADPFFNTDSFFRGGLKRMPAANVKEVKDHYEIEIATPGLKKEEIRVDIDNNILTVSGEHKKEQSENKGNYHRREFSYKSFTRSFELPSTVNSDKIDAEYKNGILVVTLPKKEEAMNGKKKEVKVA